MKSLINQITVAFNDVQRPDRYFPEEYIPYGESEDLAYLDGKEWSEIANERVYSDRHYQEQFFFMTKECLRYLFPGYMINVLNYAGDRITASLLDVLYWAGGSYQLYSYLCDSFTPDQKRAVAHWLQFLLERDKLSFPDKYQPGVGVTLYERVFAGWQTWF